MSKYGIGKMLSDLAGNKESVECFSSCLNKKITSLKIDNNELEFIFSDGSGMAIFDDAQSCCEHRYMHTDDDLDSFVGSHLLSATVQDGATDDTDYEVKESQFLIIKTTTGEFTVVNYNEHNGYYGGFAMRCKPIQS